MPHRALALLLLLLLLPAQAVQDIPQTAPIPGVATAVLPASPHRTTLTLHDSGAAGPTLFVVGGIHGDETAGWQAALQLRDELRLTCGRVYVLAPANAGGAAQNSRFVGTAGDLNRAFPGDAQGDAAQQLADAIFTAVKAAAPALVLDLHEAHPARPGKDDLGNSIIFASMQGIEPLVLHLLQSAPNGKALRYYNAPPQGSINRTVFERLGIPAITVETPRAEPLETRIQTHLALLHEVLRFYGMEADPAVR